jgi:DNA-binding NarL/FixJ family response regulator
MEKVKVFISDPQVLFREGIHFILSGEDDFEVIGETTDNEEALATIEANPPNIAILSMKNGRLNGPEVTRRIKRNLPSVAVILVLEKSDDEQLFAAMKSGASACLDKDTDPEFLLDTIRVIAQGSQPIMEALLTSGLAAKALTEFEDLSTLSEQVDNMLARLAPKEAEILGSIAAGNSLEQVTAKLNLNEETVRRNLRMILSKLVANDQARAVIEATQRSLPSIIRATGKLGASATEYVTKAEFNEFKESLMARFKSLTGGLT